MKLLVDGEIIEAKTISGVELYEAVEKSANDPRYKQDYAFSFSEFLPLSGKQKYLPIEVHELLSVIKARSRMNKSIIEKQREKILSVKLYVANGYGISVILGAMVFYE